jgi:hypothetical protein
LGSGSPAPGALAGAKQAIPRLVCSVQGDGAMRSIAEVVLMKRIWLLTLVFFLSLTGLAVAGVSLLLSSGALLSR